MSSFEEQVAAAIAAHGQWKSRLRTAIISGKSEFSAETVAKDNACTFGAWLYGDGHRDFASEITFTAIRDLHAEFHREAARVLALALGGQKDAAEAAIGLGSPFGRASASLVGALTRARAQHAA
jgi:hypothetical protein